MKKTGGVTLWGEIKGLWSLKLIFFCCLIFPLGILAAEKDYLTDAPEVRIVKIGNPNQSELLARLFVRTNYDDNVYYTADNEIDDYVLIAQPSLTWKYTTEKTKTETMALWRSLNYSDEDHRDKVYHNYSLSHQFKATENSGLTLDGFLKYDTTLGTEFRGNERDGHHFDRDYYSVTPGYYQDISATTQVSCDFTYAEEEFEDTLYPDYTMNRITMTIARSLSRPDATLWLQGDYTVYDYDHIADQEVDQYGIWLGLKYPLTNTMTLSTWGGGRYSKSTYKVLVQEFAYTPFPVLVSQYIDEEKESNWHTIASISLAQQWTENSSLTVGYNRAIEPSIYGDVTAKDSVNLKFSYEFLPFVVDINGGYKIWDSEQEILARPTDEDRYSLGTVLTWRTGKNIWLKAAYMYNKLSNHETDKDHNKNIVWLGFMVGQDILLFF